jgi:hypothetical protein
MEIKPNSYGYLQSDLRHYHKDYLSNGTFKTPKIESLKLYSDIVKFMFERIWFYMITEQWIFKPVGISNTFLGQFLIKEIPCDISKTYIDYKKTREQGKVVRSLNLHTNGRKFKIHWTAEIRRAKYSVFYYFDSYRGIPEKITGRRGLSSYIKKCSTDPYLPDYRAHVL